MAYKILIPQDIAEEGKDWLREKGYEIKMGSGVTVEAIRQDVVDCDAILARTAPFPAEVLEAGVKLRVISRHGVGVDNIDIKHAEQLGIWVTNAPESNAGSVAEHTLGLIIAAARNYSLCEREFRNGNFDIRNQAIGVDLEGKILGVLGLGKIGSLVARKAAYGLDMKPIAFDPFLPAAAFPEGVQRVENWDDIFRRSDFVTIHIPATDETRGSIGKKELSLMKPTAFLINAARGEIVDENELIRALQDKQIAGAALDVYREEPPSEDSPLFALDNLVMKPHHASLTRECMLRMALHAGQGIEEVLNGKAPTWPVNRPPHPRGGA